MLSALSNQAPAVPLDSLEAAVGQWDLSLVDSNQKCRLTLRNPAQTDPQLPHQTIRIPVACRQTIPVLETVDDWSVKAGQHLELMDIGGETVLDFTPHGGHSFAASGPSGETYEFIPVTAPLAHIVLAPPQQNLAAPQSPAAAPGLAEKLPVAQAAAPKTAAGKAPQLAPSASEIPGRYAILRESGRDTGCMLTLDSSPRQGGNKAILAPACRDQGIVVFDPVGWQIIKGQLVLTAKKGHTTHLDFEANGTWMKDAKEGKVLGLKKL